MPSSPAMRFSPGRVTKPDNHKRGLSLESGIVFREKDVDLVLFNEMQTRERDNFLLQSNDDFEDMFSTRLRYFSDYKLGISVPVRGESSDLLNADGEKNDYDWLLTPPETPLFHSLDDETPPVNLVQRGRPRSQPISISRSSTMEKSYVSSRGSASPNRLSPSPRSGSSTFQTRGRQSSTPSSTPKSSPTPSLRHATPSRTPPSKPSSTRSPRSSSPTPPRTSTGSSGTVTPSKLRGASTVPTSPGNSASPKIKAWQSNIPGFSLEAPPNLRTSLADRPASYVRGSSPASRNGRHSMSPTASRSVSSYSRGSVASSGDDDIDSLQSIPVSSSERTTLRRVGAFPNNKALAFSKKPSRTASSSSVPKRSFDSALRQMDHHKGPQNMFRPLLSSVPSSTFYVGKTSAAQHAMISRNSSVTTSSNASSDQAASGAYDIDGSGHKTHNHDDMVIESEKAPVYPDVLDEVLVFDKAATVNDDNGYAVTDGSPNNLQDTVLCSKCGREYHAIKSIVEHSRLCSDCRMVAENSSSLSVNISEEYKISNSVGPLIAVPESPDVTDMGQRRAIQHEQYVMAGETSSQNESSNNFLSENSLASSLIEEDKDVNEVVLKGAGISVLLKRSSSGKGPIVQGRTFSATSISYDDLSYVMSGNSTISSVWRGSASASSSVDMGSTGQTEPRVQRQLSGKKSMEGYDMNIMHRRTGSSLSGTSGHAKSTYEENNEGSVSNVKNDAVNSRSVASQELASEHTGLGNTSSEVECDNNSEIMVVSTSEMSSHRLNNKLDNSPSFSNFEDSASFEVPNNAVSTSDVEVLAMTRESSNVEEYCVTNSSVDGMDVTEGPTQILLDAFSEIEVENGHPGSPGSQSDVASLHSKSSIDDFQESFVVSSSDKDVTALVAESDTSDPPRGILGDSAITVGGQGETKGRGMTLEEATDTILFCSSIIHNLAYEAATIAIEKEKENLVPLEGSRPTVTILGRSTSDRKDPRTRISGKLAFKSQKVRQRRLEKDSKPLLGNPESDENTDVSTARMVGFPDKGDTMKPPKLESKCNCSVM